MRFYYTNIKEGQTQTDPSKSLGGLIATNPVPNNDTNALFSDVSTVEGNNGAQYTIGLQLKNELEDAAGIRFWLTVPEDSICKYEVSFVSLVDGKMEVISSPQASPYYSQFFSPTSPDTALDLGDLSLNQALGIWVRRTIDTAKFTQQSSCDMLNKNFGTTTPSLEKVQFNLAWGDDAPISRILDHSFILET